MKPFNEKLITKTSKYLSLVLRHKPELIGLNITTDGWASIEELIEKSDASRELSIDLINHVVQTNDKKRFSIDGSRIRANQGHSIEVEMGFKPINPPDLLYHGTAVRFLESILKEGLKPGSRQLVHLSAEKSTAETVGKRHGKPAIIEVDCTGMLADGFEFFKSENEVWLTKHVPPKFLKVLEN